MNPAEPQRKRILALDPTIKGFGYLVMEGPDFLLDWGLKETQGDKNTQCLNQVQSLIRRYRPQTVVVEDCQAKGSRRCARVRDLIGGIIKLAQAEGVKPRAVSGRQVRRAFTLHGARTKYEIAKVIARRFPELADRLPPPRKRWMSEDVRTSIFDAAAMAITSVKFQTRPLFP